MISSNYNKNIKIGVTNSSAKDIYDRNKYEYNKCKICLFSSYESQNCVKDLLSKFDKNNIHFKIKNTADNYSPYHYEYFYDQLCVLLEVMPDIYLFD